jgi:hypothetical protein
VEAPILDERRGRGKQKRPKNSDVIAKTAEVKNVIESAVRPSVAMRYMTTCDVALRDSLREVISKTIACESGLDYCGDGPPLLIVAPSDRRSCSVSEPAAFDNGVRPRLFFASSTAPFSTSSFTIAFQRSVAEP